VSQYLVLHVRPYDFEAEEGRRVRGATVTYIDPETPITADGERGRPPLSLSVEPGIERELTDVPGFYDLTFAQRRGKNGRPQLVLSGARLRARFALTAPPAAAPQSENQKGG
jgi:hypothetical protein